MKIKKIVTSSIMWVVGYAGMWSGKWFVASIITGNNIIKEGIGSAVYRTSGDINSDYYRISNTAIGAIKINFDSLMDFQFKCVLAICFICVCTIIVVRKYHIKMSRTVVIPMVLIGMYPLIWYAILKNHSIIHNWMTYRNLSITVLAVSMIVSFSIEA